MNRIDALFSKKEKDILSLFYTAGYPSLHSALDIAHVLEKSGVDMLEIGMPFSDPLADGEVIQQSSTIALDNGMTLDLLFEQMNDLRPRITVPVLLMGYTNPVMQYGFEKFCAKCAEVGIDGVILPDLPIIEYKNKYLSILDAHHLYNVLLISPQTSEARIREIDDIVRGFIYMVSDSSTTGKKGEFSTAQRDYFERINEMGLKNKCIMGFGISDKKTYDTACQYTSGAIIGSAFIRHLTQGSSEDHIRGFVEGIRPSH